MVVMRACCELGKWCESISPKLFKLAHGVQVAEVMLRWQSQHESIVVQGAGHTAVPMLTRAWPHVLKERSHMLQAALGHMAQEGHSLPDNFPKTVSSSK
eukprot:5631329-Amphidinium_carterae.1